MALLLGGWWQGRGAATPSDHPSAPAHVDAGVAAAAGASTPVAVEATLPHGLPGRAEPPVLAPAQGVPAFAAPPASSPAVAVLSLEVCDVGKVTLKVPASGEVSMPDEQHPHLFQHPVEIAWGQTLTSLEDGPIAAQAAALVLRASGVAGPDLGLSHLENTAAVVHIRGLAALAASSGHTAALQWAWSRCQRPDALPECQAVSPRAVLESAPDDGRLWVLLASADPEARTQALEQAARAPRYGSAPSLLPLVEAALPPGLPAHVRMTLLMQTQWADLQMLDGDASFLVKHCREHPESRQVCSALAETLSTRGPDLLSMVIGRAMGQQLDWPAERLKALQREAQRLQAAIPMPDARRMYSCEQIENMSSWLRDRAALGERAALQLRAAAKEPGGAGSASR